MPSPKGLHHVGGSACFGMINFSSVAGITGFEKILELLVLICVF